MTISLYSSQRNEQELPYEGVSNENFKSAKKFRKVLLLILYEAVVFLEFRIITDKRQVDAITKKRATVLVIRWLPHYQHAPL